MKILKQRKLIWLALSVVAAAMWSIHGTRTQGEVPYSRANYDAFLQEHWAFLPVKTPPIPAVHDTSWVQNPIDAFILAELEKRQLKPAARADKLTLLRRIFLDLTGLNPTPEEQQAFLADDRPDAVTRLVDDLLSRPEYGERWGRHWLDVVRYAESNGYERDGAKPFAWRYRDYVIDAFNRDKPYDRFLLEQLAGDELPGSNAETQVATTFLRLGVWDDEPADPEVDRYDQLDDVLAVTSSSFMAITLRCARCHDHKFEPFSQLDYTRFLATFTPLKRPQNDRADLDRFVGTPEELADFERANRQVDARAAAVRQQLDSKESGLITELQSKGLLAKYVHQIELPDSRAQGQVWSYTTTAPTDENWRQPTFDDSAWTTGPGGFGVEGTPGAAVRTKWDGEHIWLRKKFQLTNEQLAGKWALSWHHDDGVEVYLNGTLIAQRGGFLTQYEKYPLDDAAQAPLRAGENVLAVHCQQTSGGQYIDVGMFRQPPEQSLPMDAVAVFMIDPAARNEEQNKLVLALRERIWEILRQEGLQQLVDELDALKRQAEDVLKERPPEPPRAYIWFEDSATPPVTHRLQRGNPKDPKESVDAGFPSILVDGPPAPPSPTPKSTGLRRRLARWLTSGTHPLTARVMVNRIWQRHFGDGIVGSENDFGLMGQAPTHPELLDWLASEFVSRGWSIKQMHRLIVLSNTYQTAGQPAEGALEQDPNNDYLSWYPTRRLEAECIRDCILQASGQLNHSRGGASVFPQISAEVMAGQSRPGNGWTTSLERDADRRSVYVFVKRTLLVPELEVLDFPNTNDTCEQRIVSTVAPQALTYLNGDFIVAQSGHFARRLLRECPAPSAETPPAGNPATPGSTTTNPDELAKVRLERALQISAGRAPLPEESRAMLDFLARQRDQIQADAMAAGALLSPESLEQKCWESLCLVLLNTNEFVYLP